MMGMSLKDYDTLVRRFNDSGLAQAVNMHTFASDVSKIPEHIPETTAGKVGQVTARTATVKPVRDALNKYGFQAGEGFNVAASYMMAVRRTMKEGKLKKISQLTEDDWMSVQARASNYALAMHRANASKYQYGFMSMPMQFLSFTHKVLLTFLQSDFALGRVTGLGNKAFTHMEANKIVLGQFLLFGGAGFGLKDEAEKFLVENGMDRYMDGAVVDMLAGGFLDILLDKSIQKALGDPELDFPFDEFLAPGANFVNVMKNAWEIGTEKPLLESMLGPGATAGSQIMQAYTLASTIFSAEDPEWSELEQYRMIMDAVLGGLAAGYNDYLTARLAWKTGILLSKQGIPHDYHATREEALAKGLFGLNPQGGKDLWELTKDGMDKKRSLDEIARSYFANINTLTLKFAQEGQYSQEYYLNSVRMHQALLSSLEPEERRYVMEQVRRMEKDKRPENDSIGDKIIGFINQGVPLPTDWLIYRLERSSAVSPEDKEALKRMLRDQEKALQGYSDNLDMTLEGEYDIIENTPAPANDELAPNTGRRTD